VSAVLVTGGGTGIGAAVAASTEALDVVCDISDAGPVPA
jgi:short-subunit dehydrogenase involved in D-alanine esterification of teichoic acids